MSLIRFFQKFAEKRDGIDLKYFYLSLFNLFFLSLPLTQALGEESGTSYDVSFGLFGGYSQVSGYYGSKIDSAPSYGIYVFPYEKKYLKAEMDLTSSNYYLRSARGSTLYSLAADAGPLFSYPVSLYFQPYGGISMRVNYINLNAENLNRQEKTFKPGFVLKAGAIIRINTRFSARLGADYARIWLTGKPFGTINSTAGLQYNLHFGEEKKSEANYQQARKIITNYEIMESSYASGVEEFNRGDIMSARKQFLKVLSIKSDHIEALRYMRIITNAVDQYERGARLAREKKYYDAIPLLESSSVYIKDARTALEKVRSGLSAEADRLEKEGIAAYDGRDYKKCIDALEKVLIIDPENRNAKIYLTRAKKYLDTMEKFK